MTGEIIAIFAVLTFVISNVLFRRTERETSPVFINFFRTAIGTLTFIVIAIILGIFTYIFLLPWFLWVMLFLSFLFGQVIGDTAYFKAQKELGTTIALAISMTFPLFTFILSLIFLNQAFEIKMILSIVLIGAGIIIIGKTKISATNEANNSLDSNVQPRKLSFYVSFRSIGYALIGSLGWAIGLVIINYATNQIAQILITDGFSSIISNVIRFPFALLILVLMVWRENRVADSSQFLYSFRKPSKTWLILLIASIIGTSLGAYLYTEAARVVKPIVLSLLASASPLFSLPLSYWFNKERITKYGFLGVISTVLGVIVILIE
ncbi:MAG: DMT family transporter [Candidatus Lokiarchaeota archaeon]|nr:DMT family transporter [Candidatus Lokiarchaeota archaeon]